MRIARMIQGYRPVTPLHIVLRPGSWTAPGVELASRVAVLRWYPGKRASAGVGKAVGGVGRDMIELTGERNLRAVEDGHARASRACAIQISGLIQFKPVAPAQFKPRGPYNSTLPDPTRYTPREYAGDALQTYKQYTQRTHTQYTPRAYMRQTIVRREASVRSRVYQPSQCSQRWPLRTREQYPSAVVNWRIGRQASPVPPRGSAKWSPGSGLSAAELQKRGKIECWREVRVRDGGDRPEDGMKHEGTGMKCGVWGGGTERRAYADGTQPAPRHDDTHTNSDTVVNDVGTKAKDADIAVNDVDTNVNDANAKGNKVDTKVNKVDTKVNEVNTNVHDADTASNDVDTKVDKNANDVNTKVEDVDAAS
ncbi:hypothetical protein PLICRDRAFT_26468 [Plicaturopsis crispa FD-325 SS-3]|nr:hypothetical protein PLICRDRAFT_26468 [Plicaturopsis crispa FD-325 SS-3]